MVTSIKERIVADKAVIFEMRNTGSPMREIAEKVGISKERVRQILSRNLGTTKHKWLSTLQLCEMTGLPRNRVVELQEQGIIEPSSKWGAGKRHYFLWSVETVKTITEHFNKYHLCQVCNKPLPKNRITFCSDACRQERHKYKYMTPEEKQRVLANIRRYREKKRRQAAEEISPKEMAQTLLVRT
ncbi:MAG TPA: sigma factor-like helix-turn-helix DNA-binding protein [Dehalococcoidales bacterium]|nr:sigma factor-like helix-turn-helix DNA-binding protein [Dehalococcoidales bacterium]